MGCWISKEKVLKELDETIKNLKDFKPPGIPTAKYVQGLQVLGSLNALTIFKQKIEDGEYDHLEGLEHGCEEESEGR